MSRLAALVLLAALAIAVRLHAQDRALVVSAAASLADVMKDIGAQYELSGGQPIRLNLGGSSALARQIVEGAGVHLFVSADQAQMDVVARAGRIASESRFDLLSNQLVVIVAPGRGLRVVGAQSLADAAVRRVAMGHPASVPAGVYARRWLEKAGVWQQVAPKVVPLSTVRAALVAVREGRADAGIVYATDARSAPDVEVAYTVSSSEGPSITYPVAVMTGERCADGEQFARFLRGDVARGIFERAGFRVPFWDG